MSSLHFHPLRVARVSPETDEARVVAFEVPAELREAFRFQPGQHLTLRQHLDGEDVRRSYSICAGLDDGELRVGVRQVPGGRFSSWLHSHLKAGDTIDVLPPQGRFLLPPPALDAQGRPVPRHLLGIAGGSGITPILSILRTALAREPGTRVTLLYGNRRIASTMFMEQLDDLKSRHMTRVVLHRVFSQEQVDSPLNQGRLDAAKLSGLLARLVPVAGIDHAFVCGPFAMNDEAEAALLAAGLPRERVHVERFGVAEAPGAAPAARLVPAAGQARELLAQVTVVRDGLTRVIPMHAGDASVLDAAAAAGMDVPYSCKSGVCGTCRARLTDGQVHMDRNFALEPQEVADGFILTCQAHPRSPCLTVDFDAR